MNPKKKVQSLPKPHHNPSDKQKNVPHKFLMRTLRVQSSKSTALRAVLIKRLYLRNIFGDFTEDTTDHFDEVTYRFFKKNKLFKTLKHAHIYSVSESYAYESLKNSKNLRRVTLGIGERELRIDNIAHFINRLPVSMKTFMFRVLKDNSTVNQDIYRIAKSIRHLPKLQTFYRTYDFMFDETRNHIQKELRVYTEVFRRLKNLDKSAYVLGAGEYTSFKRAMRKDLVHPGWTGLELNLSEDLCNIHPAFWEEKFPTDESFDVDIKSVFGDLTEDQANGYRVIQEEMRKEDEKDEERKNDEDDEDDSESQNDSNVERILGKCTLAFLNNCRKREEMKTFYSFDRFPDLKLLRLVQFDRLCPLGSYVVDGFSALKHLETLIIAITERSLNTGYIFQGLSKLPLLKEFYFSINFIKNQEWALLQQFFKGQRNLEELYISLKGHRTSSKSRYLQQNAFIQTIIQDLNDKTSLKSLTLRADYWSLESISKGLASLPFVNQLHTFRLEASDDTVFSQEKLRKRVEGLCNFIKNQSESLTTLYIVLPCALEENIATHIAEAISKLGRLRELEFSVNLSWKNGVEVLQKYYQETLQSEVPADSRLLLKKSKKWNPSLAKYFKKLEELELFTLTFDLVHKDSTAWILDLIKILPNFNKLRKILLATHSRSKTMNIEHKLIPIVKELKNMKKIAIHWGHRGGDDNADSYYTPIISSLEDTIERIHEQQARRCDLMFF